MQGRFTPGVPSYVASDSPSKPYSTVFEDDGETCYFSRVTGIRQKARSSTPFTSTTSLRCWIAKLIPSQRSSGPTTD